jgi:hypothetical protein
VDPVVKIDCLDDVTSSSLDDGPGLGLNDQVPVSLDEDPPLVDPDDPLKDVPYTGDVEQDAAAELDALQTAFGDRTRKERQRFVAATDSEYWFAVCFQSREQKERFLLALNWVRFGDKYLDGTLLAEKLGIALPPANVPFVTEKPDRTLNELSLPLE